MNIHSPMQFFAAPITSKKWGIIAKWGTIASFLPHRFDTKEEAERFIKRSANDAGALRPGSPCLCDPGRSEGERETRGNREGGFVGLLLAVWSRWGFGRGIA